MHLEANKQAKEKKSERSQHVSFNMNTQKFIHNIDRSSTGLCSLPVLVTNEGASELDVVAGVTLEFAHRRTALFDHVEEHLGQLRVLVQVHQVGKAIVHFECHTRFLKRDMTFPSTVKKK